MNQNPEARDQRKLHDGLILVVHGVAMQGRHVGLSFNDFKNLFPDRVNLVRLDDIFSSWQSSHDSLSSHAKVSMEYPAVGTTCRILYNYDNDMYRSTVTSIEINGRLQIEIKISSDGFVYPNSESLSLNPTYKSSEENQKAQWMGAAFG